MKILPFDRVNLLDYIKRRELGNIEVTKIVEVGSYEGNYAAKILQEFPNASISMIDLWQTEGNDFFYSTMQGDAERAYEVARSKFEIHKNVNLLKANSVAASDMFEDESIDFVYIDADHSYEAVLNDIRAWYRKVKVGGVISGDDWSPEPGLSWTSKFGVEAAVMEFFHDRIDEIFLTSEQYYKSWCIVKK